MGMLYQVVYTGALQPQASAEQTVRDFAAIFKVAEDKARELLLGGGARVLKQEIDQANAARYREILEEIGLEVRVEPSGTPVDPHAASPSIASSASGSAGAFSGATSAEPGRHGAEPPPAPSRPAGSEPGIGSGVGAGVSAGDAGAGAGPGTHRGGVRAVPLGNGWQWIVGGFELFRRAPIPWIGAAAALFVLSSLISLVPMIGGLVSTLIGPVFLGGLMLGAHAQASGGGFRMNALFDGFSSGHAGRLVTVGALYLVGVFVVAIVAGVGVGIIGALAGGMDAAVLEQQDPELLMATMGPLLLSALLLIMLLLVPVIMAYWFAPALVVLERMAPLAAMQLSFTACWRNVMPFVLYGLVLMALVVLGSIPMFLGLLVVLPILLASIYVGYRDIFYGGLPTPSRPV